METIFSLSGLLTLPFWLLMIVLPRWKQSQRIMKSLLVIVPAALVYAALIIPRIAQVLPQVLRPELSQISTLLGTADGATIAWIHFLAFDLFVGRWVFLDSRERELSPWLMAPVLFFVLMLGPIGFLLYLAVRTTKRPKVTTQEASMSRTTSPHAGSLFSLRPLDAIRQLWRVNWPLTLVAVLHLVILFGTLIGLLLDDRVITGMPAWLKPAKFAISISIYCLTFVWLLSFLKSAPRLARLAANITAVGFVVEMVIIAGQAARGTTSHFNNSTSLDQFLFSTMGIFIVLVWLMNLLAAILVLREPIADAPLATALRLGLWLTLAGAGIGVLMVLPTSDQLAAMRAGETVQIVGAHSVGAQDGGPGLPFVGWNKNAGDFRPAHFLGLHALQVLPFIGWVVSRRRSLGKRRQRSIVFIAGLAYFSVILALLSQALRGQSLIDPDWITLAAFVAIIVVFGCAALAALRNPESSRI